MAVEDPRLPVLAKRIEECVDFYKSQGDLHRRIYLTLNAIQIVAASLVPILALALKGTTATIAAAIAGSIVAIAKGVDSLAKSHENWIRDVDTRNTLESEHNLFEMRAGPYSSASDPIALLSLRIEALMATERSTWATIEKPAEGQQE